MESNRPWLFVFILLVIAFIALMGSIGALRIEKIEKEGEITRWREQHLIWDWNEMAAWWRKVHPLYGDGERENRRPAGFED